MARRDRTVAVVGPGRTDDESLLAIARAVGAGLAESGCTVITGGLGGVMAAASRGASEAGGLVVGLLPGDGADTANEWVDVAIPTGLGEVRNALVVRSARVVVAVGGSWGTLAEIALARRRGTPVIAIRGWTIAGPAAGHSVVTAEGADEAVQLALQLVLDVRT